MLFLALFRQPVAVPKPYVCRACRTRFRFKAHAANHKRQSSSIVCREKGLEHEEQLPAARIQVPSEPISDNIQAPLEQQV